MPVIPYTATGRLTISVPVSSILHDIHMAVNTEADSGITGGYAIKQNDVGGTHLDPQDAADDFWALAKALYGSAVTAVAWALDIFTGGVFVPVAAGAATATGTGSTNQLVNVLTMTFKDTNNTRLNIQIPEGSIVSPYRNTQVTGNAAIVAFCDSVKDLVTPGTIGRFLVSRSGDPVAIGRFATCSQSKRLRKIRGYL